MDIFKRNSYPEVAKRNLSSASLFTILIRVTQNKSCWNELIKHVNTFASMCQIEGLLALAFACQELLYHTLQLWNVVLFLFLQGFVDAIVSYLHVFNKT